MQRRVILLIESSRAYGRGCLQGIAAWLRTHDNCEALHIERGLDESIPRFLKDFDAHGIIARIENQDVARAIQRFGLPTVDLRGAYHPCNGAMLDTDPAACARLAFEHFRQRGFRHFAYCGYEGINFSNQRRDAFVADCNEHQIDAAVFKPQDRKPLTEDTLRQEALGELGEQAIADWLLELP
ncbi:MAG: hypothetical protein MI741_19260, partial [Rhodospirillales bacterium]|nr:hypothetical protein [Rhodospirillales bacterium]